MVRVQFDREVAGRRRGTSFRSAAPAIMRPTRPNNLCVPASGHSSPSPLPVRQSPRPHSQLTAVPRPAHCHLCRLRSCAAPSQSCRPQETRRSHSPPAARCAAAPWTPGSLSARAVGRNTAAVRVETPVLRVQSIAMAAIGRQKRSAASRSGGGVSTASPASLMTRLRLNCRFYEIAPRSGEPIWLARRTGSVVRADQPPLLGRDHLAGGEHHYSVS